MTVAQTIDPEARYSVQGYGGIAFYLLGFASEWTEERWTFVGDPKDDPEDESNYVYDEPEEMENRAMVRAVMVGDDRVHIIDVDDLTQIGDEDYCPGCGQIGCGAYH